MEKKYKELPGWRFEIEEVSANVYQIKARDEHGRSIDKKGTEIDNLIDDCKAYAREQLETQRK